MNKEELIVWLKEQHNMARATWGHPGLSVIGTFEWLGKMSAYEAVLNKLGVFLEVDYKQTSDK